jgi:hypothetical protein
VAALAVDQVEDLGSGTSGLLAIVVAAGEPVDSGVPLQRSACRV